eukprot:5586119-Pyramimonas_sp.AAC.1
MRAKVLDWCYHLTSQRLPWALGARRCAWEGRGILKSHSAYHELPSVTAPQMSGVRFENATVFPCTHLNSSLVAVCWTLRLP